jgi:hypothetical protein
MEEFKKKYLLPKAGGEGGHRELQKYEQNFCERLGLKAIPICAPAWAPDVGFQGT